MYNLCLLIRRILLRPDTNKSRAWKEKKGVLSEKWTDTQTLKEKTIFDFKTFMHTKKCPK